MMEQAVNGSNTDPRLSVKNIGSSFPDMAVPALFANSLHSYVHGKKMSERVMMLLMTGQHLLMHCLSKDSEVKPLSIIMNSVYWTKVVKKSVVYLDSFKTVSSPYVEFNYQATGSEDSRGIMQTDKELEDPKSFMYVYIEDTLDSPCLLFPLELHTQYV